MCVKGKCPACGATQEVVAVERKPWDQPGSGHLGFSWVCPNPDCPNKDVDTVPTDGVRLASDRPTG